MRWKKILEISNYLVFQSFCTAIVDRSFRVVEHAVFEDQVQIRFKTFQCSITKKYISTVIKS